MQFNLKFQCTRVMMSVFDFNGTSGSGMGSIDSPTHIQNDCVESELSTLKLFAQFTVLLLGYGGFGCSILEVAWLELCCFLLLHYVSYCGVPDVSGEESHPSSQMAPYLPAIHHVQPVDMLFFMDQENNKLYPFYHVSFKR
eukprot:897988-Pelagomonas_calceolata.AAC.1